MLFASTYRYGLSRGDRDGRMTRFVDVSHGNYQDMDGITLMRHQAMWTICAAIYDIFIANDSSEADEDEYRKREESDSWLQMYQEANEVAMEERIKPFGYSPNL